MNKSITIFNIKQLMIGLMVFFCVWAVFPEDDKGIYLIVDEKDTTQPSINPSFNNRDFNTSQTFDNLLMNNKRAMLVGNNVYSPESGYAPLAQCVNDVRLISSLLTTCCNIPNNTIDTFTNITADEFRRAFKQVTAKLKPGQGFIFVYSGHGDKDGALVFTDGERVLPEELKSLINSFTNDTVLLLDACYSGNNEGPINFNPDHQFKNNCLRIYSSLAHLSAKEIMYPNNYFGDVRKFYEDVLGLKGENALDGNGYFISFIGYFFAEYRMSNYTKVTFNDLYKYISNKSKEYVEYLALRSREDGENERAMFTGEFTLRMNQHPKMLPYDRDVEFTHARHNNLIMKINKPDALTLELYTGLLLDLGMIQKRKYYHSSTIPVSVSNVIRISYSPDIFKGFSLGIESGYAFMKVRTEGHMMHMVPVMGIVGYRHDFAKLHDIFGMRTSIGAGVSYGYITGSNSGISLNTHTLSFKFQNNVGITLCPVNNFSIALDIQFYGLVGKHDGSDPLWNTMIFGLQFPLSVSYKF